MVEISVIIPTYKDWKRLALCLKALENQSFGSSNFEIIVVNNLPGDLPPTGFNLPNNAILIDEVKPGSYAARNTGIGIAKGDILAFTDSDCIPHKDWLINAFRYFKEEGAERIGGNVEIFYQDPENKTSAELYESVFAFRQKRNVEKYRASITANFVAKKSLFLKLGGFNSERKSGEDFGWNMRASGAGVDLIYSDDVIVYHPARRKLSELVIKSRRVFGGKKTFNFNSLLGVLKEIVYLPYIFMVQVIPRVWLVVFDSTKLRFFERSKIVYVVLYLYFHNALEYFRLLFGRDSIR